MNNANAFCKDKASKRIELKNKNCKNSFVAAMLNSNFQQKKTGTPR